MTAELLPFNPGDARIAEVASELASVIATAPETAKTPEGRAELEAVLRKQVVPLRTEIDRVHQEIKAPALEFGRKADAEKARLKRLVALIEDPIRNAIRFESERIERESRAAAEAVVREEEARRKAEAAEREAKIKALEAENATLKRATVIPVSEPRPVPQTAPPTDAELLHAFADRLAAFMQNHVPTLDAGRGRDLLTNDILPALRGTYRKLKEYR